MPKTGFERTTVFEPTTFLIKLFLETTKPTKRLDGLCQPGVQPEIVSLLSDGAKADTLTASHVFVIRIMDVAEAKVLLTDPAVLGHGTGGKIRDHPSRLDPRNKHAFCKTAVLGKRRQRPMSMDNPLYKTMMTRVKALME